MQSMVQLSMEIIIHLMPHDSRGEVNTNLITELVVAYSGRWCVVGFYLIFPHTDANAGNALQGASLLHHPPHPRQYTTSKAEPEQVDSNSVKLRGVRVQSTSEDSPNLLFFP